jgi:hypothetical protein
MIKGAIESQVEHGAWLDVGGTQMANIATVQYDRDVFCLAREYLLALDQRIPAVLDKYLQPDARALELGLIYRKLLDAATTPNMLPTVVGRAIGGLDSLRPLLNDYNLQEILRHYSSWEQVLDAIEVNLHPKGKIRREPRSIWPRFSKTILSGAEFLLQFESAEAFYSWCNIFDRDDLTRPALPMLIAENVEGLGFALACEFVKNLGYANYGKPDVQLINLFVGLELSETNREYSVLQDMFRVARHNVVTTLEVDQVFWLIGSGDFYKDNFRVGRNKDRFIEFARRELKARTASTDGVVLLPSIAPPSPDSVV